MLSAERRFVCESIDSFLIFNNGLDFRQLSAYRAGGQDVREPLTPRLELTKLCFRANKETIMPLSTPITGVDGREMHQIVVPKDTTIIISILNCNCDPALWGPDSYDWKPERWLSPLPDTLTDVPIPGIYSHL